LCVYILPLSITDHNSILCSATRPLPLHHHHHPRHLQKINMRAAILLVLSFLAPALHAFNPTPVVLQHQRRQHHYSSRSSAVLYLQAADANDDKDTLDTTSTSCRRSFLVRASGAAAVAALSLHPALAEDMLLIIMTLNPSPQRRHLKRWHVMLPILSQ
jgi:hypothetical protein